METTAKKVYAPDDWSVWWLYIWEKCLGMDCKQVECLKEDLQKIYGKTFKIRQINAM